MKPITSNDRLTVLEVPSNWRELTGPDANADASLQYCNLFAETYGLVMTETKEEVAVAAGASPDEFGLEEYADLIVSSMVDANCTAGPAKSMTINGMEAQRHRLKMNFDGLPIVYVLTFYEGKDHFHQVNCWTLESREERNMPTLSKVADSFKER